MGKPHHIVQELEEISRMVIRTQRFQPISRFFLLTLENCMIFLLISVTGVLPAGQK